MYRFMYDKISISRSLLQWAEKSYPYFRSFSARFPSKKPDPSENQNQTIHTTIKPIKGTHLCLALLLSQQRFHLSQWETLFFLCLLPLALFQSQNNEKLKQCRIISPNSSTFFPFPFFPSTSPSPHYSSGLPHPCPLPKWDLKVSWFFHPWGALKQTSR